MCELLNGNAGFEDIFVQNKESNYLLTALEQSVNILIIIDLEGCIVYASHAFLQIANIGRLELISRGHYKQALTPYIKGRALGSLSDIFDEVDRLRKPVVKQEYIDFSAGMPPRLYAVNASRLIDKNEKSVGIAAQFYDITEMRAEIDDANRASNAKTEFLSNMSHEIRTPLNAVIGMTAIARESTDLQRIQYCINKIEESSAHLLGLINDILDMSKIEAGRFELSYMPFNFEQLISRMKNIMQHRFAEKDIQFNVSTDKQIPEVIICDEQRLSQVIMNLLSNAAKFTPNGGNVLLSATMAGVEDGFNEIHFSVKDDGIGISREQQQELFSPFSQADSSISRKYGGTGLGLAISKRIVDMMGGSIGVNSDSGAGAEFTFSIRARAGESGDASDGCGNVKSDEAAPEGSSGESGSQAAEFSGKTILLVEDVEINREIVIALLEDTGVNIVPAENGEEAIAKFNSDPYKFDLIFMDIHMPVMDGYEAARRIRSLEMPNARTIPIVAMTANVFKDDVDRCLAAGMTDHVGKPIEIGAVRDKMKKYLTN